jgi:hypothetical protein
MRHVAERRFLCLDMLADLERMRRHRASSKRESDTTTLPRSCCEWGMSASYPRPKFPNRDLNYHIAIVALGRGSQTHRPLIRCTAAFCSCGRLDIRARPVPFRFAASDRLSGKDRQSGSDGLDGLAGIELDLSTSLASRDRDRITKNRIHSLPIQHAGSIRCANHGVG